MSAPVAPAPIAAPTPAPVIPSQGSDAPAPPPLAAPSAPRSLEEVMASLTAPNPAYPGEEEPKVVIQPPKEEAAPEGVADQEQPQATDLEEVPGDDPATTPETATEPEPEPEPTEVPQFEAPDGSVFRIKGPDGKYTNLPDTMGHVEFEMRTKDGQVKTYVKSPAELVQMARRGIGSEQVIERTKAEAQQVQELNQSFIELMREVFSDESGDAWIKRRDEFLQMTSPEARAERAESALAARERMERETAAQQQAMTWYNGTVQPTLERAWEASPDVTDEAKLGKLNILTAHITVNGIVPPEHRDEFARIVAGPFAEWAKQEQSRVSARLTTAQQQQQKAAQRTAQAQVNATARPMAPVGRAAPDVPARPKPKNINEALDFVIKGA